MLVAMGKNGPPHIMGSDKAIEYISQQSVLDSFRRAVFGKI